MGLPWPSDGRQSPETWRHKIEEAKTASWRSYLNLLLEPIAYLAVPHHVEPRHLILLMTGAGKVVLDPVTDCDVPGLGFRLGAHVPSSVGSGSSDVALVIGSRRRRLSSPPPEDSSIDVSPGRRAASWPRVVDGHADNGGVKRLGSSGFRGSAALCSVNCRSGLSRRPNASANDRPSASARSGGVAFPTCRYCDRGGPSSVQESGKDCSRRHSRTERGRLSQ